MEHHWIYLYGCTFFVSFLLTLCAVPLCKRIARKTGYLDVPKSEGHKLHSRATPLLGGAAMFMGWCLTVGIGFSAAKIWNPELIRPYAAGLDRAAPDLFVLVLGACGSVLLGLIDDKHALKAWQKFLGQLAIALAVVVFGGIRISLFLNSALLSCAVTVFWFLFMFNAMNFFDNMDGLAVGTSAIAFFFFMAASIVNRQYFVANLCACSAAAACAFWIFNSSPASIFMGDAGSHFLAFLLAVISTKVTYYDPAVASTRFAILIPLFVLAVPIFDTFAVVAIRLRNHKPVYVGDHNHISHRFCRMGMPPRRAVQLVHLLALIGALGVLPLLWGDPRTCFILLIQGGAILLLLSVMQYTGIHTAEDRPSDDRAPAAKKTK